jgi:hypothetical protein
VPPRAGLVLKRIHCDHAAVEAGVVEDPLDVHAGRAILRPVGAEPQLEAVWAGVRHTLFLRCICFEESRSGGERRGEGMCEVKSDRG